MRTKRSSRPDAARRTLRGVVAESAGRALSPKEFFDTLPVSLAPRLPVELRGFDTRRGPGRLLKFDYGRPEVHFEAWHHVAAGRFEVGLHLEGSPAANQARFQLLAARIVEIRGRLPHAELEPWDRGWCRLYETFAATALTSTVLDAAARRLAAYMTTLQPMLED